MQVIHQIQASLPTKIDNFSCLALRVTFSLISGHSPLFTTQVCNPWVLDHSSPPLSVPNLWFHPFQSDLPSSPFLPTTATLSTNLGVLLAMSQACCPSIKLCTIQPISILHTNSHIWQLFSTGAIIWYIKPTEHWGYLHTDSHNSFVCSKWNVLSFISITLMGNWVSDLMKNLYRRFWEVYIWLSSSKGNQTVASSLMKKKILYSWEI